ncbi:MAG: chemotaxis protein CheC [Gammaproteobacteria bacterium SG8_47]|nr:MAG: chemotaxis protein CheC [Gammaproteobacteria bacterium SG8_47]
MTTQLTICDDSSFARKQMARALPADWPVEVTFASNGKEGLEAVKSGKAQLMFLDLNMPIMDGYQVLEAILKQDLSSRVIVVSGDVQPEARRRVTELGALDFIKKPIDQAELGAILERHQLRQHAATKRAALDVPVHIHEVHQEIANVAMGRAADMLARLLDAFVVMPIPSVNMLEPTELQMALAHVGDGDSVWAVCQGFIGAGIAGEALLIFRESSFPDIAELMHFDGDLDDGAQVELLMDIANVLIGACLKGIADQLDFKFSQGHPLVLGRHVEVSDLVERNAGRWRKSLAIELGCTIENRNVSCDLLLLFTEDSIAPLNELASYLND